MKLLFVLCGENLHCLLADLNLLDQFIPTQKGLPKYYGESIFIFLQRMWMEKAKELLTRTNYTLQKIPQLF